MAHPQDFYDRLHTEFGFVLDVCASADNAKTPAHYALDHPDLTRRDGLTQDWAAEAARLDGAVWMNPPYGRPIGTWMAQARQAAGAGATVVTLVPVRADTQWWHEHVLSSGAEVRYVRGRLTFGAATNTAAFASAVVIYRPTDVPGQPGPVGTMPAKARNIEPAKTPDALIDNFWGTALPPAQFALAEAAVKETARAMAPASTGQANLYLSSLTAFLAGPCGWNRTDAPHLRALLTEQSVVTVTEAMRVTDRTKVTRREVLHRICRRLGTMPASTRNATLGYPLHPDRFIVAGITRPLPVAALVQAHALRHGAPLADKGLAVAFSAVTAAATGNATAGDEATVPSAATIRSLAEATSPEVLGMTSSTSTLSTTPTTTTAASEAPAPAKRMTRAQRLAFAKQSQALAEAVAATHARTLELGPVDTTPLDADTIATCTAFRPTQTERSRVWQANLRLAQRLLLGTRPPSARVASSYGSSVARFLTWFSNWPGRPGAATGALITVEELLAPGVVESFVRLEGLTPRSASTYRSVVRRALDSLDPAPRRTKLAYRPGVAPYQPEELDQFTFLATNQRTLGQRAALCTAIALGAGAGLDTSDLRGITPDHLTTVVLPDGVEVTMVNVPGSRARTVPLRAAFADLLQAALDAHTALGKGLDDPLIGRKPDRINVMRPLTSQARTAAGEAIEVHQSRLRNSWMVAALCAPVPLADLMRAAGLTSPRPVENLLRHCPQVPQETITSVLASLKDVPTGTGVRTGTLPDADSAGQEARR